MFQTLYKKDLKIKFMPFYSKIIAIICLGIFLFSVYVLFSTVHDAVSLILSILSILFIGWFCLAIVSNSIDYVKALKGPQKDDEDDD